MANINIFALGGQDENGKDLFVLEVENDIYIINTGIKFPINDRWGVDGIIADTTYLKNNLKRIKGVFITHAHDEAFAALPWLLMDLPGVNVYGSQFTISVAENRISKYKIGHSSYKLNVIDKSVKIGNIEVSPMEVANSIPGSVAFNFKTEDGSIIFASNMTVDDLGAYGKTDLKKMKEQAGDILALILDSRRANFNGTSSSKKSVVPLIEEKFKQAKDNQRIIVGAYDEEMYSLQEIINLANKYDRPVAFYGSAFSTLFDQFEAQYNNKNAPKNIVDFKDVNKVDNAVILVTGTWSRIYQRFDRISQGNDVFLKFRDTDTIIMITPPINGMEVDYSQMLDGVAKIAPNIASISDKDFYRMRATKEDIKQIASVLKPKYFVPASSLYRYQAVAGKEAIAAGIGKGNVVYLQNGKILYLKDGAIASQKGRVKECGDVIIQGFGVGDVSYEVIRERQMLSAGGLITISAQMDRSTKQLVGSLGIQIVGVISKTQLKDFSEEIQSIVIQKFEEAAKFDYREIQNSIRKRVQKTASKKFDKEPLVIMTFYEV